MGLEEEKKDTSEDRVDTTSETIDESQNGEAGLNESASEKIMPEPGTVINGTNQEVQEPTDDQDETIASIKETGDNNLHADQETTLSEPVATTQEDVHSSETSPHTTVVDASTKSKAKWLTKKKSIVLAILVVAIAAGAVPFLLPKRQAPKTMGAQTQAQNDITINTEKPRDTLTAAKYYLAAFIKGDKTTVDSMQSSAQKEIMSKAKVNSFYDYCKGFKKECYDLHMLFRNIPSEGTKFSDYTTRDKQKGQAVTITLKANTTDGKKALVYIALGIYQEKGKWVVDSEDYDVIPATETPKSPNTTAPATKNSTPAATPTTKKN